MATRTKVRPTAAATHKPAPQAVETVVEVAQQAAPIREPVRQQLQPDMPLVPGRAVAMSRSGKPVQRTAATTGVDKFKLPEGLPPPGWSWEWKAESVNGMKREDHIAEQQKVGWEFVMYESYQGMFAPAVDDNGNMRRGPVRRDGLVLMERAEILTREAYADEKARADEKVGTSRRQYTSMLQDQAGRTTTAEFDHTAQKASYVRTATETLPPLTNRQQVD